MIEIFLHAKVRELEAEIDEIKSERDELKEKLERVTDLLKGLGICEVCGLREERHKLQCPKRPQ